MNRREFIKAAGLRAGAILTAPTAVRAAAAASGRTRSTKPNVLFLFSDDQREDTVGALGNPHISTPNLDKLVESGFAFRNAYCMGGFSGAVCLPSRMMTLRGRAWFSVRGMPADAPNFPRSMNEAGYVSYHHGKRGNTDREVHKSFAHSHYLEDGAVRRSGHPGKLVADDAIAFLKRREKDKPFFMYLAFGTPHDPRVATQEYLDKYDVEKIPLPANFQPFHPFDNGDLVIRDERLAPWPRTEAVIRQHLRDYYAVITYLDEQIGRIVETLKEIGEYDNTVIIFSSDQGLAVGSHGLMGKQSLYEHSMGVPLVFAGPGIPKGESSDAFVYLFDVFPTVCDLIGERVPEGLDGKSLATIIRGREQRVRRTIFLAYKDLQRAVRQGRWKLIRYPQINKTQLFNLESDPHETNNLADDPAHAGRIEGLMKLMARQQRLFGDTEPLTSENPKQGKVDLEYFKNAPATKKRGKKAASKR
ncbi:MAG: sulfatase-like hydrolase/transferase [Phycisphaerales bacterium]|nr:MAG: sulfatase-like hydrolase/transferase [Phycisphaerales bacterium]